MFTLDEAGDFKWRLNQTPSDYLPFLTCDSYELAPCPDCKVYYFVFIVLNLNIFDWQHFIDYPCMAGKVK